MWRSSFCTSKKKVLLIVFLASLVLVDIFVNLRPEILAAVLRLKYSSPISFHNIKINFPAGFMYSMDQESVTFYQVNKAFPNMYIGQHDFNENSKELLVKFSDENSLCEVEKKEFSFKGFSALQISYIDKSWNYTNIICVLNKNILINYTGTKKKYNEFIKIVEGIVFLQDPPGAAATNEQ